MPTHREEEIANMSLGMVHYHAWKDDRIIPGEVDHHASGTVDHLLLRKGCPHVGRVRRVFYRKKVEGKDRRIPLGEHCVECLLVVESR